MIARCVSSTYACCGDDGDLVAFLVGPKRPAKGADLPLKVGEMYLVVAFAFGPYCPWLFVADRFLGLRYPLIFPCRMFSLADGRRSRSWQWGVWVDRCGGEHDILAPSAWSRDPVFHGKLFEGNGEALRVYEAACVELLMEFPLPWIALKATPLGSANWVSDPRSDDAWESNASVAMTQNPRTGELLHNPLYQTPPVPYLESRI
jgi:hypothetical protein